MTFEMAPARRCVTCGFVITGDCITGDLGHYHPTCAPDDDVQGAPV